MISCAVYGCINNTATNADTSLQYFPFPKHHPHFVQQWITACWRADPIDINNSHICAMHFDANSYTSEYKLLDYLGNYTRILRYDAVPTLFLPHSPTSVMIKPAIQQPVTLGNDSINQHEMKGIMVYEVQNVTAEQITNTNFDTSVKEYIEIEPHQAALLQNVDVKFNNVERHSSPENLIEDLKQEEEIDDEKYKHITNMKQLQELKNDNVSLHKQMVALEETVKRFRTQIEEKNRVIKEKDEELKKLMQQYDRLNRASMSLMEQRNILSKVFSESQIKILSGKKKIYWSNDDMAIGYTIRHLSNKRCYMYLSKNLNIPLPALSSIKRWSTLKKNEFDKTEKKEEDNKFADEESD